MSASDGAEFDRFGTSASVSEDTAIIGAYLDDGAGTNSGSAYIYVRTAEGWSQAQKLTADDGAPDDRFGVSVAFDNDTAVIGAYYDDDGGSNAGAAYVFMRSDGIWLQQQKLTASDASPGKNFGRAAALSGDTIVVGAIGDAHAGLVSGAVYVFTRSSGVWTQRQKLVASDGMAFDEFGRSVAVDGDTILVGADLDDVPNANQNGNSGSAYIFVRANGVWTEQQKLLAADDSTGDYFGGSISLRGDTALIGAPGDSYGSAYVFVRDGQTWAQQAKLRANEPASDEFGSSVALGDDAALIGAYATSGPGVSAGSAYFFVRSEGRWTLQHELVASNAAAMNMYGSSVALSGHTAIVGASGAGGGVSRSGSAYFYSCAAACDGDLDADGDVDLVDFGWFQASYKPCP